MPNNLSPHAQAISDAIVNLYRIEAMAHAIEDMTEEVHIFTNCKPPVRGLTEDMSNTIHQLAGMLRETAALTRDFSHVAEEGIRKSEAA